MTIGGTSHNDTRTGTEGHDEFDMSQGGNDTVFGLGGGDIFFFGAKFNKNDHIYGGDSTDTLVLEGDYSAGVPLLPTTLVDVEEVDLLGDFNYNLTFADGNVAQGRTLMVVGALSAAHTMIVNGSGETNGNFIIFGGDGGDALFTGTRSDIIYGGGGPDIIYAGLGRDGAYGGDGIDSIAFIGDGALGVGDTIDGGPQNASLTIWGDYSAGLTMQADTIANIDVLHLGGGYDYTLNVGKVTGETLLQVFGNELGSSDVLNFSAAGAAFQVVVIGGAANDTIEGGDEGDLLAGALGADTLIRGTDFCTFRYFEVADSTGSHYDTIVRFDALKASIWTEFLTADVDTIDPKVSHGKLSTATFNADLGRAIGADELHAGNAVLFQPGRGTLANQLFLIVDGNGEAGYQAAEDLVIRLDHATHMSQFSEANLVIF